MPLKAIPIREIWGEQTAYKILSYLDLMIASLKTAPAQFWSKVGIFRTK
jgi:hypothetical protein